MAITKLSKVCIFLGVFLCVLIGISSADQSTIELDIDSKEKRRSTQVEIELLES